MAAYSYNATDDQDSLRMRLLPLICMMNAQPLYEFHPTWLQSTDEWPDIQNLLQYREATPHLAEFMMRRYRLRTMWIHDFTELRYRLLLVNTHTLNRLVFYLGLIVLSPYLRKLIDGSTIKRISHAVGAEEFEFARKKAAFYNPGFVGKLVKIDAASITPENICDQIVAKGMVCLGLLFWSEEKYMKTRLAIKLPKENARYIVSKAYDKAPKETINKLRDSVFKILMKLIKEVEPTWQTIFE